MASLRIHKTRWVLVFVYKFCNHGPVTYHWIHPYTRNLEISSTRDDIDGILSLPMALRSMAMAPRIHKTRWVLDIVYTFCKHGPATYHLIDSSTWNWDISSTRDDIDGISPSSTTLDRRWCYQNRQNKVSFGFCVYILQTVTTYIPLDRCIHTDFGNIVCDGRYRLISSSSTTMLLFFLLFGVRPNRYLTYRTIIYVDRAFYIFKVHTVHWT
jgi:hypothetical protein